MDLIRDAKQFEKNQFFFLPAQFNKSFHTIGVIYLRLHLWIEDQSVRKTNKGQHAVFVQITHRRGLSKLEIAFTSQITVPKKNAILTNATFNIQNIVRMTMYVCMKPYLCCFGINHRSSENTSRSLSRQFGWRSNRVIEQTKKSIIKW